MSAFIVSDKHISTLLNFALDAEPGGGLYVYHNGDSRRIEFDTAQEIGQALVNENYRSVNYRYEENATPHEFRFTYRFRADRPGPVAILKACQCYDYQACETPDYRASLACAVIKAIKENAITKLDGWETAKWEIN